MKKWFVSILAFSAVWSMLALDPDGCDAQSQTTQGSLSDLDVFQIALMPFLMGQLESPNTPIAKPLSKSLTQLVIDSRELPENAGRVMTRIVHDALKLRVEERLIPSDRAAEAYRTLLAEPSLDTPRKRAVRLGQVLEADLVMVGTVWRFR